MTSNTWRRWINQVHNAGRYPLQRSSRPECNRLQLRIEALEDRLAPALAVGDVIFNEYAADNDANGNDFVELLVLKDVSDLRGLRISDNEIVPGVLNNNESV